MSSLYRFHNQLILRTPARPFQPETLTPELLQNRLDDPSFQDALYLASPDLYQRAMAWRNGALLEPKKQAKLLASLAKYYSRMTSRCTPFGLFAACSLVDWGDSDTHVRFDQNSFWRHTRFDMHFLCALAQHLAKLPVLREHLLYYPNSSYYTVGDEIRYVEYSYEQGNRQHRISAVTGSAYVRMVLDEANGGANRQTLLMCLTANDDVTTDEAAHFLDAVVEAQLLVSELEPAITGDDFLEQLTQTIRRVDALHAEPALEGLLHFLENVKRQLDTLDTAPADKVSSYRQIIEKLTVLELPFDHNKLIQTDLFRKPSEQVMLNNIWQAQLLGALNVLQRLNNPTDGGHLTAFAQRFYDRYEDREMPLLYVLDVETGIGYVDNGTEGDINPLLDGLALPTHHDPHSYTVAWNPVQHWLHTKLLDATRNQADTIELTDNDLATLPPDDLTNLPPSVSALFRLADLENGQKCLYLEGFNGSSAINLLGRFAHGHPGVGAVARSIADEEQRLNPDVIFAEIVHLPESRVGNILLHPVFRAYEIPFLAKSSRPAENQLDLRDLFVSVRGNEVILRSKRLNKRIIPRLSTAHNYSYRALPVYQFLCDLQHQGMQTNFSFSWGHMARHHTVLPRVVYQSVVLHPTCWQLTKDQLAPLQAPTRTQATVHQWVHTWRLPRFVVLADGDNELLVDWANPLSIDAFLDAIKNRPAIVLTEFLHEHHQPGVTDAVGNPYTNQWIAPLLRTAPMNTKSSYKPTDATATQRQFTVGSEWLYIKLYCGVKSADQILLDVVGGVVDDLNVNGLIDSWFFIRYNDPKPHLRLRLHLPDATQLGDVLRCLRWYLLPVEEAGIVWKTQIDTYVRELERYGADTITLAETLFNHDSVAVLAFLTQTWGDEREQLRWAWGVRAVDDLLLTFGLSLTDRHRLMQALKTGFQEEFKVDRPGRDQIDTMYRTHRPLISQWLSREVAPSTSAQALLTILDHKRDALAPVAAQINQKHQQGTLSVPRNELLASYVHMLLNRLISSNQRLHELLIYDFLYRHYNSELAQQRRSVTPLLFA